MKKEQQGTRAAAAPRDPSVGHDANRRRLLVGGLAAVSLLPASAATANAVPATDELENRGVAYRETAHVRQAYHRMRF